MSINPNVIYDVGLHKGEDTDFYLKKGYDVVAFEADPDLIAHCKRRFHTNIALGRLHIIEGAITAEPADGPVVFYKNTRETIWGTALADWAQRNVALGAGSVKIEVDRVNIADAFHRYGIPYYLKIDIEGADSIVLEALRRFEGRPQFVSIESEKVDFSRLKAELKLLSDLGYKRFKPVQQKLISGSLIRTRNLSGDDFDYRFEAEASGPFGDDLLPPWLNYDECLREYKRVFRRYRLFGDNSFLNKFERGRRLKRKLEKLYRKPLPGWYDTHAALS